MTKTLTIFILISSSLTAQVNMDSLNSVWNDPSIPDTTRFKAKFELARELSYTNNKSSQEHFREVFQLSKKLGGKYIPRAMQGISVTHFEMGNYDSALFYAQQAYDLSEKLNNKRGMCNALINMYRPYAVIGNDSLSLEYGLRAVEMAKELNDSINLINTYGHIGLMYGRFGESQKSLDALKHSYQIALKYGDVRKLATAERMLAFQYYTMSDLGMAIKLSMDALKILQKTPAEYDEAAIYNNLALIYKDLREYDKTLEFYKKTEVLANKIASRGDIAGLWFNMASLYLIMDDFDNALLYNDKANEAFTELNYSYGLIFVNNLYGQIFLKQNQFEESIIKFQSVFTYSNDNLEAAYAYGNQAKAYYQLKEYQKAIESAEQGLSIASEKQNYDAMGNAGDILHKAYAAVRNYPKAYEVSVLLNQITDSINKEEDKKALFRQEYQYEYEKKVLADSLAQNEEKLLLELAHQEEMQSESRTRSYITGAGILFLLLAGGGWSRAQYIKKANARLEVERNRAEESERFKQRFLANMSHEIRTPMNSILGMTELTLDTRLTKKQQLYLEAIKNSSENLLVIINDILDLSKIEQGKLTFEKIPFNLRSQLELAHQTLQFKAEEKGLHFQIEVEDKIPEMVLGDPSRLLQVLINLAGNAIKFTETGSVKIEVSQLEENLLKFRVTDTGIGIPENKQHLLFESFKQADDSTSRKYGGTGLGLAISKDLVEMQGGTITVESKEAIGSTFSFTLPLPASDATIIPTATSADASSLKNIRILIAEDKKFNQIVIKDTLENLIEDAHITLVENGQLAVEALQKEDFDVVLMDGHMPVMDGLEATRLIRNSSSNSKKNIPIIALTASVLSDEVQKCKEAGMNAVLPKPFKREDLVRVLGQFYPANGLG